MKKKRSSSPIKKRCAWPGVDPLMLAYHDDEWGAPTFDDSVIFEFLVLESAQAGLSWRTVLHKREHYRKAFAGFQPKKVAKFDDEDIRRLMGDAGIIRNRLKISAAINNAARFVDIQRECGSFSNYIWGFTRGRPIVHQFRKLEQLPTTIKESDELAKDLKKRGFKFLGSTTVYAHMQATGMVNDHLMHCFRYKQVGVQR